jgi:alkylhydroperoxidase/carboxymuconolactone decarboxylase family protein YurZ
VPSIKTEKQRYDRGLKRRKQVLGAKYVQARLKNRHPFTDEFQAMITRYAWGELWTRPAFDDRTRRLLVLAMMVALKSWEEFDLHVRAGLERELSPAELKEMLMLAAIYCGVPAANTAFGRARRIIEPGTTPSVPRKSPRP